MVTAEMAVTIFALIIAVIATVGIASAAMAKLRAVDAAYSGARASARGENGQERASSAAGENAQVSLRQSGESITVEVRIKVRAFGPLLPAMVVDASATAMKEPGESP
ncbi:MAG: pilus assembly protein TadE [Corynebacteriales bacterium]|nr:pilus assembly protein TadE [Mycobacteriales bacterium]